MSKKKYHKKKSKEYANPKHIFVRPQTSKQKALIEAIKYNTATVALGVAGTGKSFVPTMMAAQALQKGDINQIILTRPTVAAGETIGFVPGTEEEKMYRWLQEPLKVLKKAFGPNDFAYKMNREYIKMVPFEIMRGLTLEDAFIICEEGQNTTESDMELFTTRIGENVRVVIDGDVTQTDLLNKKNGLEALISIIKNYICEVPIVEFTIDDVVRSEFCKQMTVGWANYKST